MFPSVFPRVLLPAATKVRPAGTRIQANHSPFPVTVSSYDDQRSAATAAHRDFRRSAILVVLQICCITNLLENADTG